MLTAFQRRNGRLNGAVVETAPPDAVWLDLYNPSAAEIASVEAIAGVSLPSEAQMREIETSNRLYERGGVVFMTGTIISEADSPRPVSRAATFVLCPGSVERPGRLVTIRHSQPRPFAVFAERLAAQQNPSAAPELLLCGLWQAIIARSADVVERLAAELDDLNDAVFQPARRKRPTRTEEFRVVLSRLGAANDMATRIHESMFSLARVVGFPEQAAPGRLCAEFRPLAHRVRRDIEALNDQVEFLGDKISFLLDATLGLVNVEQNAIIRILSIAATVFLPPTLIASLYGMNFEFMPELAWPYGYPMALGVIALSALGPYLLFKLRGWL